MTLARLSRYLANLFQFFYISFEAAYLPFCKVSNQTSYLRRILQAIDVSCNLLVLLVLLVFSTIGLPYLAVEVLLDRYGVPLRVYVEYDVIAGDDGVGPEDGAVGDVLAAEVEQPGGLVQGGDDGGVVALLGQGLAQLGHLVLPGAAWCFQN